MDEGRNVVKEVGEVWVVGEVVLRRKRRGESWI